MTQLLAALDAIWRVLLIGLVLGAGLPALFSVGVRQLAVAGTLTPTHPAKAGLHRVSGWAIFVLVGAVVMLGIAGIVAHGFGVRLFG